MDRCMCWKYFIRINTKSNFYWKSSTGQKHSFLCIWVVALLVMYKTFAVELEEEHLRLEHFGYAKVYFSTFVLGWHHLR